MVEGGGLENRFPVLRNGGSNPSPSATVFLLRGINNVGSKRVAMAALKSAFEGMGYTEVRTVLASGNVLCESPRKSGPVGRTIARRLEQALGFPVAVVTRTGRELKAIVESEPFKAVPSGTSVQRYVTFLAEKKATHSPSGLPAPPPGVRIVRIDPGEIYSVVDLSRGGRTPDLMRFLERTVGRVGTTRNWRTVLKLVGRRV